MENKKYVVRANGSGVWAGDIQSQEGDTVVMTNARRLWQWFGAASLSELAMYGANSNSKFPCKVNKVTIFNVIEIIEMTDEAWISIESVKIWTEI